MIQDHIVEIIVYLIGLCGAAGVLMTMRATAQLGVVACVLMAIGYPVTAFACVLGLLARFFK